MCIAKELRLFLELLFGWTRVVGLWWVRGGLDIVLVGGEMLVLAQHYTHRQHDEERTMMSR